MNHKRVLTMLLLPLMCLTALALIPASPAGAAETVPFSITIRHANCIEACDAEGIEAALESTPDFYVKVFVNGVKLPTPSDGDEPSSPRIDDDDSIDPFWTINTQVPVEVMNVPVTIQLWDYDLSSGDDLADISPRNDDNNLDFRVDRSTGRWIDHTGQQDNVNWPQNCSSGDGGDDDEPSARLCFDVGGDADGDGLLDSWEKSGYDDNSDGIIDVDLPGMGARWDHKDLFLELDYVMGATPSKEGIEAMRKAFAAAPLSAGSRAGSREAAGSDGNEDTFGVSAGPNPDGQPGITLHVDAGALADGNVRKGQRAGTCADGVDNDGKDGADGYDPDCRYLDASVEAPAPPDCDPDGDGLDTDPSCLVGDAAFASGGGGQFIADPGSCGVDDAFYRAKNGPGGLNPARRYVFRYAISATQRADCKDDDGQAYSSGGQGELGGNDFIDFNHDGGTIMHELGHNLNLHHGGDVDNNCKPNYVSIMNYNLQGGIPRNLGSTVLDYSPPRIALDGSSRGNAPLGILDEDELNENVVLDPTDAQNTFVFINEPGGRIQSNLNIRPNWNGDVDGAPGQPWEDDVEANIDTVDPDGNPKACENDDYDELDGANDWDFVSLSFHGFGEASDGAIRPEREPVPTTEDLEAMRRAINTTDLAVTQADAPDPVAAGTDLVYTVTVANAGMNPANSVEVTDTLPDDVTFRSSTGPCAEAAGVVTCHLGSIAAGGSRTFTITVGVPAGLVYDRGGPTDIINRVEVRNLVGPDPLAANDVSEETTRVIAVADVKITDASAVGPLEVLIGEPGQTSLSVTVENGGPSTPVDTVITTTAAADPGVVVTPATSSSAQTALASGSPQAVSFDATIECTSPGPKTIALTPSVALAHPDDVDPVLDNNTRTVTFGIDCVVPIAVNVRPGGFPNSINLNTDANLAALTTRAGEYGLPLDFDATRINVAAVRWGLRERLFNVAAPAGATEIHGKGHLERSYELDERTRDGDTDMVMHFKPDASGLSRTTTEGCIKGRFTAADGRAYTFLGCDSVRIVPAQR
ncbi:MAG: DUF11 domain-containing protein [Acidimicrobiia bacterium]|nr:DUF11 domain-containing protein [Acidimicrobiia bacterium]